MCFQRSGSQPVGRKQMKRNLPHPMPLFAPPPRAWEDRSSDTTPTDRVCRPQRQTRDRIRALEKPGLFKPRPYVYICIRCRGSFIANETGGGVIAVDRSGNPLPEPHNARLVETFADGPCFGYLHRWRRNRQTKVISQPGKFARGLATAVAFLFGLPRPISMIDGKRIHPAAAITVHDLIP